MSDSKEHIIIVAAKLFLEKNFKEVTMKELVEKTGLSKGAFYHYFESKEQLYLAVLEYFFSSIKRSYSNYSKESLRQFYQDYIDDSLKLTKEFLAGFEKESSENSLTMNYFTLIFDAIKLFPEFRNKIIAGFDEEISYWTQAANRARKNGEIKTEMTDKDIAETFMYLSDGVAMHMLMRGENMENIAKPFKNLWDKFYLQIKA